MKPDAKIRASSRPLRVAYLVEDGPDAGDWLSAIFRNCHARDGGRQSLVIPVIAGVVSDAYWQWLMSIDPDEIVLATYDDSRLAGELIARRCTAELNPCKRGEKQSELSPRVSIEGTPLASISWLPFLKATAGWHRPAPRRILDSYPMWVDDGLVCDNFGLASEFGFPVHAQLGVGGLILTPASPPADRWRFPVQDIEEICTPSEILDRLATDTTVVTTGMLANLSTMQRISEHSWSNSFSLFVGDTFLDRVSGWNAALLLGDSQSQIYKALRVPAAAVESLPYLQALGNFLRSRNWLGSQNSPARVVVRSHSVRADALSDFSSRLAKASHSFVESQVVSSMDDCCAKEAARPARGFLAQVAWQATEVALHEGRASFNASAPKQVEYCFGQNPIFSRGAWQVDLDIDRADDIGRFSNIRESWQLPARFQLPSKFTAARKSRITGIGQLAVRVDVEKPLIEVGQPSDLDFFYYLLTEPQAEYVGGYDIRRPHIPGNRYEYCNVSDKGRYLNGTLGLFGGLSSASSFLSNHYWRTQFLEMAKPARAERDRVVEILKRKARAKDGVATIADEASWQQLADQFIKQSTRLRIPREVTSFSKLLPSWLRELDSVFLEDANMRKHQEEMIAQAPRDLRRSIEWLLQCGIFFRGHEWVCRKCSHRNWVGVGELRDVLGCSVCSDHHLIPVDVELDLRLNEFFSTCLREHDTLSVVAALDRIQQRSRSSFFFAPQLSLFRKYSVQRTSPDRELDLVCMCDGMFAVGEVKLHTSMIGSPEIRDLAEAAAEVSADVAIISALEGDQSALSKRVMELESMLPRGIRAEGFLSDWNDRPSHFLPC